MQRASLQSVPAVLWLSRRDLKTLLGLNDSSWHRYVRPLLTPEIGRRDKNGYSYDGAAVCGLVIGMRVDAAKRDFVKSVESEATDALMGEDGGAVSAGLERYRMARAQLEEMKLADLKRETMLRSAVRQGLGQLAELLRKAGQDLQRRYGAEAQQVIDDTLSAWTGKMANLFGGKTDE